MSGLHKFEELTAHFTEEDWAAVAEMEAEIDATMPTDEPCAVVPMRMMRELEDAPCPNMRRRADRRSRRPRF